MISGLDSANEGMGGFQANMKAHNYFSSTLGSFVSILGSTINTTSTSSMEIHANCYVAAMVNFTFTFYFTHFLAKHLVIVAVGSSIS